MQICIQVFYYYDLHLSALVSFNELPNDLCRRSIHDTIILPLIIHRSFAVTEWLTKISPNHFSLIIFHGPLLSSSYRKNHDALFLISIKWRRGRRRHSLKPLAQLYQRPRRRNLQQQPLSLYSSLAPKSRRRWWSQNDHDLQSTDKFISAGSQEGCNPRTAVIYSQPATVRPAPPSSVSPHPPPLLWLLNGFLLQQRSRHGARSLPQ